MCISQALIGLNIQQDANHEASFSRPWINEVLGNSIDLIGRTKLIWMQEHWMVSNKRGIRCWCGVLLLVEKKYLGRASILLKGLNPSLNSDGYH
jgi:hypothetical protein